jgi:hypothetical protein
MTLGIRLHIAVEFLIASIVDLIRFHQCSGTREECEPIARRNALILSTTRRLPGLYKTLICAIRLHFAVEISAVTFAKL